MVAALSWHEPPALAAAASQPDVGRGEDSTEAHAQEARRKQVGLGWGTDGVKGCGTRGGGRVGFWAVGGEWVGCDSLLEGTLTARHAARKEDGR